MGKSILSLCQVHFFIVKCVKKLDFVKMSGERHDGDNPFPHFSTTISHHMLPQFTTTNGHVGYKKGDFPPLMIVRTLFFLLHIKPSKKCKLKYTERWNT